MHTFQVSNQGLKEWVRRQIILDGGNRCNGKREETLAGGEPCGYLESEGLDSTQAPEMSDYNRLGNGEKETDTGDKMLYLQVNFWCV